MSLKEETNTTDSFLTVVKSIKILLYSIIVNFFNSFFKIMKPPHLDFKTKKEFQILSINNYQDNLITFHKNCMLNLLSIFIFIKETSITRLRYVQTIKFMVKEKNSRFLSLLLLKICLC